MLNKLVLVSFFLVFAGICLFPQKEFFGGGVTMVLVANKHETQDTVVMSSEVFKINGLDVCWTHYFTDYETRVVLINHQTDEVLIDTDFIISLWLSQNYKDDNYFQQVNEVCFVDLNFDGWKDFACEDLGSHGAISKQSLIYLFRHKSNLFEYEVDLFEGTIRKIDSVHCKLIFINDFRRGSDSVVYYFDSAKTAQIISTESFLSYVGHWETGAWFHKEYSKTMHGEVIETRRDSILIE